jgi:heat shock protein HslJ
MAVDPLQARGEAPAWRLTVTPARIVFATDDGAVFVNEQNGGATVPREGRIAGRRIVVDTTLQPCALSSAAFAQTVRVMVDGRTYNGCGGEQSQGVSVASGTWTILSVNGRPTPVVGTYEARFERRELSLRLGCGQLTAPYTLAGRVLSTGAVRKTAAPCADPSFEQGAEKALALPFAVESIGGEQIILRNALGTLSLARPRS